MAAPRKALLQKMERAWAETNEGFLPAAFRAETEDAKWQWPGETIRSDGTTVGSPRDVVDTGALRDSYDHERLSRTVYRHVWQTPYAAAVINGAQLRNGSVLLPRDITQAPLEQLPSEFAHRFRALP